MHWWPLYSDETRANQLRAWLYGEFQPGLKFQPGQPDWNFVAIIWQTSARAEILALAPNMKFRANSLRRIKMAPRTRIGKIRALFLSQFGLLAALNFQLFGMVAAYKMMELKRNLSLAAYLSARKTYLQRKRRNLQARRVRRKPRSLWVINGRTDQWWQNMIGEDVPEWCWRKNFRMS